MRGSVNDIMEHSLTLDEAIRHCRDVERSCNMNGETACGSNHRQLAIWLEEYKRLLTAYKNNHLR